MSSEFELEFKGKKKKKKTPATAAFDAAAAATADDDDTTSADAATAGASTADTADTAAAAASSSSPAAAGAGAVAEDEFTVALGDKKKKKKKAVAFAAEDEEQSAAQGAGDDDEQEQQAPASGPAAASDADAAWAKSDRDYSYEELVDRVFRILNDMHPADREKKRHTIKPPQLTREGSKKVVFLNFAEICKGMNRPLEHVKEYILTELNTSGSIDGSQRLVLRGRLQSKDMEGLLRKYISEYVTCQLCKSPLTALNKQKETRLMFLTCSNCGAHRSVTTIKTGYKAQVGRRKHEA